MSRHSWVITLVVLAVTFLTVRWLQRQKAIDARLVAFKQPPPDPNVLALRGTEFYVRLQSDRSSQMSDAIRAAVGSTGTVYPREEHAVVLWNDFRAPEDLLGRLSHDQMLEIGHLLRLWRAEGRWNDPVRRRPGGRPRTGDLRQEIENLES